jgi:tetratricopeptide (TPR) repeat protein
MQSGTKLSLVVIALLVFICVGGASLVILLGGAGAGAYFLTAAPISVQAPAEATTPTPLPVEPGAQSDLDLTQAQTLYDAGSYEEALSLLDVALEKHPNSLEGWLLHGRTQLKLKDNLQAIKDFSKAIGIDEKSTDALHFRAFAYVQEHMYDEAIADLDKLLSLDPANAKAWKLHGDCRYAQGKLQDAIADAQKSCELGYQDGCIALQRFKGQ